MADNAISPRQPAVQTYQMLILKSCVSIIILPFGRCETGTKKSSYQINGPNISSENGVVQWLRGLTSEREVRRSTQGRKGKKNTRNTRGSVIVGGARGTLGRLKGRRITEELIRGINQGNRLRVQLSERGERGNK